MKTEVLVTPVKEDILTAIVLYKAQLPLENNSLKTLYLSSN